MRFSLFSKFFNQKALVGLDIQPENCRLVQLGHAPDGFDLQKTASLALDPGIFAHHKIMDWDALTARLYEWVRELELVGAVTAAALPASLVRLLRIEGHAPNPSWLAKQLEQALPGMGDGVMLDYSPLAVSEPATLVAVTKRDYLENYIACLTEAGLQLKIIDVDTFALQRVIPAQAGIPILWQQRETFTLIWNDAAGIPQQIQWPATYGEQVITDLLQHTSTHHIQQLLFCGSTYYSDLLQKTKNVKLSIQYFSPAFSRSGVNMPDYLLALGLAMREVPVW